MTEPAAVIETESRFAFGRNWTAFLASVDEKRIEKSCAALRDLLRVDSLRGKRFIDVGCGSGLSSLAALRLDAEVFGFDYDRDSVSASRALKQKFAADDRRWRIEQGSALDGGYLGTLGQWDVVYSWGVLHHTGAMWEAMDNISRLVAPAGQLAVALYNDQGYISQRWKRVKASYVAHPWMRPLLVAFSFVRIWGWTMLLDLRHLQPGRSWREYGRERGMSAWHDLVDWVGGYPFEVARPEEVFDFYRSRGFTLEKLITRQGRGCNEFCFRRNSDRSGSECASASSRPD
jgi:2-polyprenyl-6-hydroxyphenyl methylase/3-demethylubiquinone-9 3-methyltransferase